MITDFNYFKYLISERTTLLESKTLIGEDLIDRLYLLSQELKKNNYIVKLSGGDLIAHNEYINLEMTLCEDEIPVDSWNTLEFTYVGFNIDMIEVPIKYRGQGHMKNLLTIITKFCDTYNILLRLSAQAQDDLTDIDKLVNVYKVFNFKPKAKKKQYNKNELVIMERKPKKI
jgi:hypothetical protein